MDHITILAELYQAYKDENLEYAFTLRDAYPEIFAELLEMVREAENKAEFDLLLEDKTK